MWLLLRQQQQVIAALTLPQPSVPIFNGDLITQLNSTSTPTTMQSVKIMRNPVLSHSNKMLESKLKVLR